MNEGCNVTLATDFFKAFLAEKMCGKCLPCMMGSIKILDSLEMIAKGEATADELVRLTELSKAIKATARCKLGRDAADFLASSLDKYSEEYLEHINEKRCASSFCDKITVLRIEPTTCTTCGACKEVCEQEAIIGQAVAPYLVARQPMAIRTKRCIKCGRCQEVCISGAIEIV